MTQISPRFTLAEFLRSETAARMGRKIEAPAEVVANLARLCEIVLEPLRTQLGRPIVVLSGYRPRWLNDAVGGSKTSDHMTGCAADIIVPGLTPFVICRRIERAELPVKQCIHEFGEWCHVSVGPVGVRVTAEFLTAVRRGGRTVHLPGIVEAA